MRQSGSYKLKLQLVGLESSLQLPTTVETIYIYIYILFQNDWLWLLEIKKSRLVRVQISNHDQKRDIDIETSEVSNSIFIDRLK